MNNIAFMLFFIKAFYYLFIVPEITYNKKGQWSPEIKQTATHFFHQR